MATADNNALPFYPAFCFQASPTHFTWVKIAAVDVLRLKRRAEYPDQQTYFYTNHPIRFISLVGIIIACHDLPTRTILTLDDSTGATLDIVVIKGPEPSTSTTVTTTTTTTSSPATHISPTTQTPIDITPLVPGTLTHVKGTISTFRNTNQLQLERYFLIRDTNAEMRFVEQRSRFLVEVLSVPWRLGGDEVERLRGEMEEEEERVEEEQERVRRRERRRVEREERDARRIQKGWEWEERVRAKEAGRCRENGVRVMREIEKRRGEGVDLSIGGGDGIPER
ncbi:OB-fold domain-containing protein [Aspergillus ibericus CBS 121593]|uniref:CST complex subunit Stn1 N-terminal domain-containing protein n=1 Tax=Aspergillus ibericus CBS 121593 TaxID=1448316 RepID=A0A395GII4_9EURO|nr:hypothetical protein BO80DRAFT_419829 [Aspergillus ibericus CBS 121593]RAK95072.1 hypothetical protein BO80DRAFT_419829 [Aspergillus ibericus CBS 121593]